MCEVTYDYRELKIMSEVMLMDWHQINYFQTVAQVQHITRAAEQLSISQPLLPYITKIKR